MRKNETHRKVEAKRVGLKVVLSLMILAGIGYFLFLFVINVNFREVVPNKVYRSGQPSPNRLRKWVTKYGIKTVINLRGSSEKEIEQEQLTADELGVKFVSIYLSGKRLATTSELADLIDALENAETPVLLHCRSGIDRSGMAGALAAMVIGNVDYDEAKWQAYVAPGPWKRKDYSSRRPNYIHNYAHISDFFKLYESYCRRERLDSNNWQQLKRWALETGPLGADNVEYKLTYSYFPLLSKGKRFFPVWKFIRDTYVQFILELLIIFSLVVFIYHKLLANKSRAHNDNKTTVDER
jgi:protein tyrosine phosphatase (PTP) superfamily phosphohydrolase (DUF442 family)